MKIDERRQLMVCYTASGNALITHARSQLHRPGC